MNQRIQCDDATVGGFTHYLSMHLSAGRHIDHQVTLDAGGTGQPVSLRQRLAARELLLGRAQRAQVGGSRIDTVLGEVTLHHEDLATSTQCPTATNRIYIDAKRARGLEEGRSDRESSALT